MSAASPAPDDTLLTTLTSERRGLLLVALVLLSLLTAASVMTVRAQTYHHAGELLLFGAASIGFALMALLLRLGYLPYRMVAASTLGTMAVLIFQRIASLFATGHFDDPGSSFFMPVFASLPILYLMGFVLLPVRAATRISALIWLLVAVTATALTAPYWSERPVRSSLVALMSFLWIGHALYLVLFAAFFRQQARQAEAERRAREAAVQSEAQFRAVFDLAAVAVNVTDASGCYRMVNQRMADFLGYTQQELLGLSFFDVTPQEDLAAVRQGAAAVAAGSVQSLSLEKRYRRKDGQVVYAEIHVRELPPGADSSRRFICVAVDITERKRAEAAAAEHRRIRDFYFDKTPLSVVEFDRDMLIRRWSPQAERLFGWSEAEVVGRSAEAIGILSLEQAQRRKEYAGSLLVGKQERSAALIQAKHRSGRSLWVEVYNAVTHDGHRADGVISMALDVTERQEMLRMLNESEARFRGIFNQAAVGIALLDERGRWLAVNHKLCEITGYDAAELGALDFQTITHPDDLQADVELAQRVMRREIDHYSIEKRYLHKAGHIVWIMLWVRRLDATETTPAGFVSVIEDISERKASQDKLVQLTATLESQVAERTAQLRELVEVGRQRNRELAMVTEMGALLSAAQDQDELVRVLTRYLPMLFGRADGAFYRAAESGEGLVLARAWGALAATGAELVSRDCWGLRRGELHRAEGETDALHCAHLHESMHPQPKLCAPVFALGQSVGLLTLAWGRTTDGWAPEMPLVRTVTEKIGLAIGNLRLREELARQATIDPLTGLHNRRWLDANLDRRVKDRGAGGQFSTLLIDVDHFKGINDRYGHEAGDIALQAVARTLARSMRTGEAAVRLGGEEFVVVVPTGRPDEAVAVAERLRLAISALRVQAHDRQLPSITVSIGVACHPLDGADAQTLIAKADGALYAAKRGGRNQVRLSAAAPGVE